MLRISALIVLIIVSRGAVSAQAPAPVRFQWQPGQTLTYKLVQRTRVEETTLNEKTQMPVTAESKTTLALTRRWTVKAVDPAGVATLEMSILQVRSEITQPDKSITVNDSENPEQAQQMAEYLNKPIVVVRVDSQGRLVEVKVAKGGSAARLHAELPFRMTLPDAGPAKGQGWERSFSMKLDPPHGTGESFEFAQKYACRDVKDGLMVVGVGTQLKAPPKTTSEQVPLVPMLWEGELYFNVNAGHYHAARLGVKAELKDHLGAGTKFEYESTYTEDVVAK